MAAPTHQILQQIAHLDQTRLDFPDDLDEILHRAEYETCVQALPRDDDDLMWLIEYLNDVAEDLDPSTSASRKCLRELRTLCGEHRILPPSRIIQEPNVLELDPHPFDGGGFGDVYKGTLNDSAICAKHLRVSDRREVQKALKMFCQEVVMWNFLDHPNILPLLGTTIAPAQLVSRWMPHGNLRKYVEKHPDADKLKLLSDVAKGIEYLHSRNVIHGDLKGVNVLIEVDDYGSPHALVADFGTAIVTKNLDSIRAASRQRIHTEIWAAPEVLEGENPTKESDVYSFAMVMFEVFEGWDRMKQVVTPGELPTRPTNPVCTDDLWALMQHCSDRESSSRPVISETLGVLEVRAIEAGPALRMTATPLLSRSL